MSIKYFVSGDIHSYFTPWMFALDFAGFEHNNPNHKIIICGDLFDRGSQTIECFEFAKKLANEGRLIYIRGNHEDLIYECVEELKRTSDIHSHHLSNGTLRTVADFIGVSIYDLLCNCYDKTVFKSKVQELLSFIDDTCVDYFEVGNCCFVHGWVPVSKDEHSSVISEANWKNVSWKQARWANGMKCWSEKLVIPDKTVVCGHWHTSWGHHKFHGHKNEFPNLSIRNSRDSFKPFIEPGIIAIDSCVAYTGFLNVVVFDDTGNMIIMKENNNEKIKI